MRTAGILINEGVSRTVAPTLQILGIGPGRTARKTNDLFPYLPAFRPLFVPLPQKKSDLELKATSVQLSDIECITKTIVKVGSTLTRSEAACVLIFWIAGYL